MLPAVTLLHPWRELRRMPHIALSWPILHAQLGRTDGHSRIELDRRLGQAERRCTLAHELVHVELGHGCRQPEPVEARVRAMTARRLLPLRALATALAYSLELEHVAFDCWVTRDVLDDRLADLKPAEYDYLMERTKHHREDAA